MRSVFRAAGGRIGVAGQRRWNDDMTSAAERMGARLESLGDSQGARDPFGLGVEEEEEPEGARGHAMLDSYLLFGGKKSKAARPRSFVRFEQGHTAIHTDAEAESEFRDLVRQGRAAEAWGLYAQLIEKSGSRLHLSKDVPFSRDTLNAVLHILSVVRSRSPEGCVRVAQELIRAMELREDVEPDGDSYSVLLRVLSRGLGRGTHADDAFRVLQRCKIKGLKLHEDGWLALARIVSRAHRSPTPLWKAVVASGLRPWSQFVHAVVQAAIAADEPGLVCDVMKKAPREFTPVAFARAVWLIGTVPGPAALQVEGALVALVQSGNFGPGSVNTQLLELLVGRCAFELRSHKATTLALSLCDTPWGIELRGAECVSVLPHRGGEEGVEECFRMLTELSSDIKDPFASRPRSVNPIVAAAEHPLQDWFEKLAKALGEDPVRAEVFAARVRECGSRGDRGLHTTLAAAVLGLCVASERGMEEACQLVEDATQWNRGDKPPTSALIALLVGARMRRERPATGTPPVLARSDLQ
eukprot:Hpha_TRINITY_DN7044_c0_g1::TRINITY_DN7044_c0_g1_i1::g.22870::m.22870